MKNDIDYMTLPETRFYPQSVPKKWDDIEINAVCEDYDGNCDVVEDSENSHISYYSVYLHNIDGGIECISDCQTEAEALVLIEILKSSVLNFVNNGRHIAKWWRLCNIAQTTGAVRLC